MQNGASFRDSKSGQKGLKYGQVKGFQIAAKRLQIGVGTSNWGKEISNRDKRDFKQGAGITNRWRTSIIISGSV